MKLSITSNTFRCQHSGKVDLSGLWLRVSIIFRVCRQNCKANVALFAKWCLLEYVGYVETLDIISGGSCTMGFRHNVPSLYSTVSLIVTV
ncbi:hypothetical protein RchiOBHm_Chr4g0412841 [Rosa chinensis]|uniref:Uncharacterized protein n=1 Tax=Rosa chinensis TaxID=74649 RepID=A0A2P6QW03_ROSCH|nr:hypothetical protein RchiOBHm_Chr4g0412841 [Rosa chinensis]